MDVSFSGAARAIVSPARRKCGVRAGAASKVAPARNQRHAQTALLTKAPPPVWRRFASSLARRAVFFSSVSPPAAMRRTRSTPRPPDSRARASWPRRRSRRRRSEAYSRFADDRAKRIAGPWRVSRSRFGPRSTTAVKAWRAMVRFRPWQPASKHLQPLPSESCSQS